MRRLVLLLPLLVLSCDSSSGDLCGSDVAFPEWSTSAYKLPYPVGQSWEINQANCSGKGHSLFWEFGYDVSMTVGSEVTAARGGTVGHAIGHCADDADPTCNNLLTLVHPDGEVTLYSHLQQAGLLVEPGDTVEVGDTIARSGNSGWTEGFPHLSRHACNRFPGLDEGVACPSLPLTFSNTRPNPRGLIAHEVYTAE